MTPFWIFDFGFWIGDKRTETSDFEKKDMPAATYVNNQFVVASRLLKNSPGVLRRAQDERREF